MTKRKRGARTIKSWYGIFFYTRWAGLFTGVTLMRFWPDLYDIFFMIFAIGMLLHYLWYLFGDEPERDV